MQSKFSLGFRSLLLAVLLVLPHTRADAAEKEPSDRAAGSFRTGQKADRMRSAAGFNYIGDRLPSNQTGTIAPGRPDKDEVEKARRRYPPDVTRELLTGKLPPPPGFDRAFAERLGQKRLDALRTGTDLVSGDDNDIAALCLMRLGVATENLKPTSGSLGGPAPAARTRESPPPAARVPARFVRSEYPVASGKTSGFFKTGQDADIMLSGIDFNRTGGPLLFNHPMGIASEGAHLLLADTYNNRVLIWNTLPQGNAPPDLVVGQKDFDSNNPGTGLDQLNWPVNVATDGKRIVVADTENERILIWNSFPAKNGAPADLVLQSQEARGIDVSKSTFHWPWGVWTDGQKLVVTSTRGGGVLIWNRFPTMDHQPADLVLSGRGKLGTPRTITSDGKHLIVGDHNPRMGQPGAGTFFWKTFPTTNDAPFDFYRTEPRQPGGPWLRGCFTRDLPAARQAGGKLLLLGSTLHLWNAFPEDEKDEPDLSIRGYDFHGGDHTGVAVAGERIYIVTGNANKVVVYNSIPTKPNQLPDFAIGSPDLYTNTLETNFIISNPIPASNGKSLFVASDFDRKLYVWKKLPDRSGAHPDLVYDIDCPALDIALWQDTLVLAGMQTVYVWRKLPLDGNSPDLIFDERIGSVRFQELRGVAVDDRYFYLSDFKAGQIYVWKGIPSAHSEPAFSLNVEKTWRISSDGNYLTVATFDRHLALIYRVAGLGPDTRPAVLGELSTGGSPHGPRWFNGVSKALASHGHFFVAEGFSRVHAWSKIEDALAGQRAEVILGKDNFEDVQPQIGRNKLHYPAAVWFDGSYLWVGETKFSERILRFSPSLSQDEGQGDSGQIQHRKWGNHLSLPKDPVVMPDPGRRLARASDPAASLVAAQPETWWPKFRGDLLNTGYSTSSAPHTPLIAWSKKIPRASEFWSSPSIFKDKVYVGNSNGNLYCLNGTTGDLIWTFYGNSFAIFSSPALAYGMVFFGAADRKFYALPAADPNSDGTISETEIIWDHTVGPSTGGVNNVVPSSPAIKDGKLFLGAIDQYFYCFNATNGQVIWKTWTPYRGQHAFSSSPALYKGKVFAATGNQPGTVSSGRLYCFSETTGRIIWEFDIDDITYSSPVIDKDNDRVVIANSGDWIANAGNRTYRMYSLAIEGHIDGVDEGIPDSHIGNSDLVWSYNTRRYVYSSPALHEGRLYFGGSDGNLRCVDAKTGKTIWVYETPTRGGSGIMGSPAVADGMVFVGTADGRLVAVPENDPNSDGVISPDEIVWSYEIGGKIVCSPAIANGAVFIGSRDGVMYCFGNSAHE